jgi:hypothetical protein
MAFDLITRKRTGRDWSISVDGDVEKAVATERNKIVILMASGLASGLAGMTVNSRRKGLKTSLLLGGVGLVGYSMYRTATNPLPLG